MEWNTWTGGECPCAGMDVALRFRGGGELNTTTPQREDWEWLDTDDDIIAWRLGDD